MRGVANNSLGNNAKQGLYNLNSLLSSGSFGNDGYTVTSAMRDEHHEHYREGSKHSTGDAVDFGVADADGKAMTRFFFDDWDSGAKKLSKRGLKYLKDNNAELVDERGNTKSGAHFHLEFNDPSEEGYSMYPEGHITSGGYPIWGVQV